MKEIFKKIIVQILKTEAEMLLKKYKPFIVAITGNLGKTTTKDYVAHVYKKIFVNENNPENVRATEKSLNSEFGVPLTILGEKSAWDNPFLWLKIIFKTFFQEYFRKDFPQYLILEVGADHKGDIKDISEYVKPDICILTAMQKNLVHGEYFKNRDEHIKEKKYLADAIKQNGILIYNADDEDFQNVAEEIKNERKDVKIISFGENEKADIKIVDNRFLYNDETEIEGQEIKLRIPEILEIKLYGTLGDAFKYAIASSIASLKFLEQLPQNFSTKNFTPSKEGELSEIFSDIENPKSRMRILKGINNSTIVDDTYNASPKATENAINTIDNIINKGKKILVLGHMAELGDSAEVFEHKRIAELADKIFDKIIFIGRNNNLFEKGISEKSKEKVLFFKNSKDAIETIKEMIGEYDLVLCKGSQSARVEKVVVEILQNFSDKYEVCRQEKEWEER
jgi:UDP-N-acetylmuramoyl-tripeptide--D-alanyl-D-alanine ligase